MDYPFDNGFYVGTWVSDVEYASDDTYSYEHDPYFGCSGGIDRLTYYVGWLYYNYDSVNNSEAFNGVPGAYTDYCVSFAIEEFTFTISDTDLDNAGPLGISGQRFRQVCRFV